MPQSGFSTKTGHFQKPSKTPGDSASAKSTAGEDKEARDRDFIMSRVLPRIGTAKQKAEDARSDLGVIYQEVEDRGHHSGALKLCIKLQAMEDEKRTDFLRAFFKYGTWFGFGDQLDLLDQAWPLPRPMAPSVQAGHAGAKPAAPDAFIDDLGKQKHRQDADNIATPPDGAINLAQRFALKQLARGNCHVRLAGKGDDEMYQVSPPGDADPHAGVGLSRVEWAHLILNGLVDRIAETDEWTASEEGRARAAKEEAAAPAATFPDSEAPAAGGDGTADPVAHPEAGPVGVGEGAVVVGKSPPDFVPAVEVMSVTQLREQLAELRDTLDDPRLVHHEPGAEEAMRQKIALIERELDGRGRRMPTKAEKDAADSEAAYKRVQRGKGSRKKAETAELATAGGKPGEASP